MLIGVQISRLNRNAGTYGQNNKGACRQSCKNRKSLLKMKLVVTALLASLVVLAASEPFSWTFLDPASPEQPRSRWRAGAAFGSGAVFVFGGKGTLRNANDTGVQGNI